MQTKIPVLRPLRHYTLLLLPLLAAGVCLYPCQEIIGWYKKTSFRYISLLVEKMMNTSIDHPRFQTRGIEARQPNSVSKFSCWPQFRIGWKEPSLSKSISKQEIKFDYESVKWKEAEKCPLVETRFSAKWTISIVVAIKIESFHCCRVQCHAHIHMNISTPVSHRPTLSFQLAKSHDDDMWWMFEIEKKKSPQILSAYKTNPVNMWKFFFLLSTT